MLLVLPSYGVCCTAADMCRACVWGGVVLVTGAGAVQGTVGFRRCAAATLYWVRLVTGLRGGDGVPPVTCHLT
jgi:hypothetical protein